jgi:hypothetical protein
MHSNEANAKDNERYRRARLVFLSFLVLSPVLPYVITLTYNMILFATVPAQIHSLPSYPEAKLIREDIVQDYSSNRCQEWRLSYETTGSPEEVSAFYQSSLLDSDWHQSGGFSGFERYEKSTWNVLVNSDPGKFTLTITVDAYPIFDLWC